MKEWICYAEFGNPSGHSFLAPILYDYYLTLFFGKYIKKLLTKVFAITFTVLLTLLQLFSRLYLGMHALN